MNEEKKVEYNKEIKWIKDNYGEKFAQLCKGLFPTLLETPGLLSKTIYENFAPNPFLYNDIKEEAIENAFKNYVYKKANQPIKENDTNKTVRQLFDEAGYNFYECHNEKDIQSFKKYYAKGEELCTFEGDRLEDCYVFWAVKKNVDEIKRENFTEPKRQDEYGTSVISIQFDRGDENYLSIKNRYNHAINKKSNRQNPDATFSNNLENIQEGLTRAFEKEYNLNINKTDNKDFVPPGYIRAEDRKIYKYNTKINVKRFGEREKIYFCPNNIIIDNDNVIKYDKEKYTIFDKYILDKYNRKVDQYYKEKKEDSFVEGLKSMYNIIIKDNLEAKKALITESIDKGTGNKTIKIKPIDQEEITIVIDKCNRMIEYENKNLTEIKDDFLSHSEHIEKITIPNVKKIGDGFITKANKIRAISLPNVEIMGDNCLSETEGLEEISAPKLKKTGDYFLVSPNEIKKAEFPELISIGDEAFSDNNYIEEFNAPKLISVGTNFAENNTTLKTINIPNLKSAKQGFLKENHNLKAKIMKFKLAKSIVINRKKEKEFDYEENSNSRDNR